jgi:TrmH family RNA methyltransferase
VFDKLAYGQRRDGVVAVACRPDTSLARLQLPECPMVVVLVGVEKPGNVGAVVRSADGAGASAVIVVDRGGDPFNTNAIRASLGTVFSLPIAEADATATLAWLRQHRLALRAARPQASQLYSAVDWTGGSAIILGSEAAGLDDAWQADDIVPVALPMQGAADSLNVSVTAAVLCYEALRQRR